MRAVELSFAVLCLTLAMTITNEMDSMYYNQYNRYLFGTSISGPANITDMQDINLNNTLDKYGSNKVPAGLGNSPYLFYGGGLIDGLKLFFDFIGSHTIGMGSYVQRVIFPSMIPSMSYAISILIFFVNIVAIITLLRGVYVGR